MSAMSKFDCTEHPTFCRVCTGRASLFLSGFFKTSLKDFGDVRLGDPPLRVNTHSKQSKEGVRSEQILCDDSTNKRTSTL